MPRTRAGSETRDAVLHVALELFRSQGYEATTLRQIAQGLDVTAAALYYHFPAKDEILVTLVDPLIEGLEEILEVDGESPEHLLDMYLELLVREHALANLLAHDPAASNHPEIGPRRRRLFEALETRVAGARAAQADRTRAFCAIHVVRSIASMPIERARRARPVVLRAALAVLADR